MPASRVLNRGITPINSPQLTPAVLPREALGVGFVLVCAAFVVQSTVWHTNGDTSWLITVIDRIHTGDRLYVDIIEVNPPISVWLYFVPVHISYWTGISAEVLVRINTLAICLTAAVTTGWIIRAGKVMTDRAVLPVMGLLFALSTILVGNVF